MIQGRETTLHRLFERMAEEVRPIWECLPDEPPELFDIFVRYAKRCGVQYNEAVVIRAVLADDVENQLSAGGLRRAAIAWGWRDRTLAFADAERTLEDEKWSERRRILRESDWEIGSQLREAAKAFIHLYEHFRTEETHVDRDGKKVIVLAVNVTATQLTQLARASSELQRLAVGEPTSISEQRVGISASDLVRANAEIEQWRQAHGQPDSGTVEMSDGPIVPDR